MAIPPKALETVEFNKQVRFQRLGSFGGGCINKQCPLRTGNINCGTWCARFMITKSENMDALVIKNCVRTWTGNEIEFI